MDVFDSRLGSPTARTSSQARSCATLSGRLLSGSPSSNRTPNVRDRSTRNTENRNFRAFKCFLMRTVRCRYGWSRTRSSSGTGSCQTLFTRSIQRTWCWPRSTCGTPASRSRACTIVTGLTPAACLRWTFVAETSLWRFIHSPSLKTCLSCSFGSTSIRAATSTSASTSPESRTVEPTSSKQRSCSLPFPRRESWTLSWSKTRSISLVDHCLFDICCYLFSRIKYLIMLIGRISFARTHKT